MFFDTQRLNLLMTVDHRVEVGESHTHTESWYMGPGARNKKKWRGRGAESRPVQWRKGEIK